MTRLNALLLLVTLGCAGSQHYPTWHPGPHADTTDRRTVGERCLAASLRGRGAWPGGHDVRAYDRCMRAEGWIINRGDQ
jgi:hypothetical protein